MNTLSIPLPRSWPRYVKSAMLQVVSLAHEAATRSRCWAADSLLKRVRLQAKLDRVTEELVILTEIMRIKDSRMNRMPAHQRPSYTPEERMAILELRACRNWTAAHTATGFWVPWFPFTCLQTWPLCWWLLFIMDHFSRTIVGFALFPSQPSSAQVLTVLRRATRRAGASPRHLVSDHGTQFDCAEFKRWCSRLGIRHRLGAVGKYGSIAVIERFIRSFKNECTRRILVPLNGATIRRETCCYLTWYNEHRPHTFLSGRTPQEVYRALPPANEAPRIEPRRRWPARSPCASPQAPVDGSPGARFEPRVSFLGGRRHLPIIELKKVA
jgi:transposase InsO family protein